MTVTTVTGATVAQYARERMAGKTTSADMAPGTVQKDVTVDLKNTRTDDPGEGDAGEATPKQSRIKERFSEMAAKNRQLKEENARLKAGEKPAVEDKPARNDDAEDKPARQERREDAPTDLLPEPKPDDFETLEKYFDARTDWKMANRDRKAAAEAAQAEAADIEKQWRRNYEAAKKELPDFEEVLKAAEVPVHNDVKAALMESKHGPKVLYEILSDDDLLDDMLEAGKLSLKRMSAAQMIIFGRALGRIERSSKKEAKPEPAPKRAGTKAPPPINPIRQSSETATGLPIDENGKWTGDYQTFKNSTEALKKAGY